MFLLIKGSPATSNLSTVSFASCRGISNERFSNRRQRDDVVEDASDSPPRVSGLRARINVSTVESTILIRFLIERFFLISLFLRGFRFLSFRGNFYTGILKARKNYLEYEILMDRT